jgi:hypothetical protein
MHLSTSSCAVNIKKILHLYVGHFLYFKLNVSIKKIHQLSATIKLNSLAAPKHWKSAQYGKPGLYSSANSTLAHYPKLHLDLEQTGAAQLAA